MAYAYAVENNKLTERVPVKPSDGKASFSVTGAALWVLSANEYETNSGSSDKKEDSNSYFLADGNYYVNISLYKASSNETSMGDVAFKNNRRALVTVSNGKITKVQVGTNPVTIDPYYSAIISFGLTDGTPVTVNSTGALTTKPAGKSYSYIKTASFTLPDSAQPTQSNEVTYVPVTFYVPDTPMDAAVGQTLYARLRFQWSTATATTAGTLYSNSTAAAGDSSITGQEIVELVLEDEKSGTVIETNTGVLSDKAKLSVTELTSGTAYKAAEKALKNVDGEWKLYAIETLVDGESVQPNGAVTLKIPAESKNVALYRINADGSKTLLRGDYEDGMYVVATTSLGDFALVELAEAAEASATPAAASAEVGEAEDGSGSGSGLLIGLIIAALGALLLLIIILVKRKKDEDEEEETKGEK